MFPASRGLRLARRRFISLTRLEVPEQFIDLLPPFTESVGIHPIVHVVPVAFCCDNARVSQDLEMLRDGSLRQPQPASQCPNTQVSLSKQNEHAKARFDRQDSQSLTNVFDLISKQRCEIHIRYG
jgi:hypothetical protein